MKLSQITKRENCFFTKDGQTLRTIQDLLDYFLNCDDKGYSNHVTPEKNDFANWVSDILLFPELGKTLKNAKTVNEARDEIMEFFQIFDYRSKRIPEEKAFNTVDGCALKNIQELYYYLNNCDDNNLRYHANAQKNDFANWASDVLLFPSLAAKMRVETSREGMINVLKDFLTKNTVYGTNEEYSRYMNERSIKDENNIKTGNAARDAALDGKNDSRPSNLSRSSNLSNPPYPSNPLGNVSSISGVTSNPANSNNSNKSNNTNIYAVHQIDESNNEEKIDLSHKLDLKREEEVEKEDKGVVIDVGGFRQFTDEELEKFVNFSRVEKSFETDAKLEYLKAALLELKNMVRELRRAEKDPLIADLLLRNIGSKIDYYGQSKNIDDYNHIIRLMKDAQHEIEECSTEQSYNIAEEIMKDLKLQGFAMKKA